MIFSSDSVEEDLSEYMLDVADQIEILQHLVAVDEMVYSASLESNLTTTINALDLLMTHLIDEHPELADRWENPLRTTVIILHGYRSSLMNTK